MFFSNPPQLCHSGISKRHRNIVGNRITCDPGLKFTEKRICNAHSCGHYSLKIGKWSPCYPKDRKISCSVGIQWRNISCFKISGPEAPLDYCIEELYGGELAIASQVRTQIKIFGSVQNRRHVVDWEHMSTPLFPFPTSSK